MPLTIISHRTMSQPVIYAAKAQSWQKLRFPIFNGWLLRGPHGFFFFKSCLHIRVKSSINIASDKIQKYFVQFLGKWSCSLVFWEDSQFL